MGAPFGLIKELQKRTGADRATCKRALEEHNLDADAAAASIGEINGAPAAEAKPSESQKSLDQWAEQDQASSVSIVRQEVGDGETYPAVGDTLHMHYVGTLEDGTVFDNSRERGRPFQFKIGQGKVIRGWDVGVMKMSLGEKAILFIGPDYGYGASGNGPIPPNANLKFEVELLKIERQTSCLGPGQHGGAQKKHHEYAQLADQLLGRAPQQPINPVEHRLPDDRQPMPLTKDMPR